MATTNNILEMLTRALAGAGQQGAPQDPVQELEALTRPQRRAQLPGERMMMRTSNAGGRHDPLAQGMTGGEDIGLEPSPRQNMNAGERYMRRRQGNDAAGRHDPSRGMSVSVPEGGPSTEDELAEVSETMGGGESPSYQISKMSGDYAEGAYSDVPVPAEQLIADMEAMIADPKGMAYGGDASMDLQRHFTDAIRQGVIDPKTGHDLLYQLEDAVGPDQYWDSFGISELRNE